jgi:hypothetical protein
MCFSHRITQEKHAVKQMILRLRSCIECRKIIFSKTPTRFVASHEFMHNFAPEKY